MPSARSRFLRTLTPRRRAKIVADLDYAATRFTKAIEAYETDPSEPNHVRLIGAASRVVCAMAQSYGTKLTLRTMLLRASLCAKPFEKKIGFENRHRVLLALRHELVGEPID